MGSALMTHLMGGWVEGLHLWTYSHTCVCVCVRLPRMVASYLVHHSYCATAEAFAKSTDQAVHEELASIKNRQSESLTPPQQGSSGGCSNGGTLVGRDPEAGAVGADGRGHRDHPAALPQPAGPDPRPALHAQVRPCWTAGP